MKRELVALKAMVNSGRYRKLLFRTIKKGSFLFEKQPFVPREGVEPPRRKALVPKTSVSTNSTIAAKTLLNKVAKFRTNFYLENIYNLN